MKEENVLSYSENETIQYLCNYAYILMGTSLSELFLHLLIAFECQLCLNLSYKLKG